MKEVRFDAVHYCYPPGRNAGPGMKVFSGLTIQLEPGNVYVMTGPNGSGKSTFARLMAGIIHPDEGTVSIGGRDVKALSLPEVGRSVGLVMQDPSRQLIMQKPADEIAFGLVHNGCGREEALKTSQKVLEEYGLIGASGTFTQRLSKGEQVRLAMASVAALNPDWLVLDESFASLDSGTSSIIKAKLGQMVQKGAGALVISHSGLILDELKGIRIDMKRGGTAFVG